MARQPDATARKTRDDRMDVCTFHANLARQLGVTEAVFLQQLYHTICQHQEECVYQDGIYWFPCAVKDWERYIPLWSGRQIDRIVKNCLQRQVIFLRHLDADQRRRRGWYGIHPELLPVLEAAERPLL